MTRYLIDANILSDVIRAPDAAASRRLAAFDDASLCTSVIVAAELRFGAVKRASANLSSKVELVLGAIRVEPFREPADMHYAEIRAALERAGTPIGNNDMLIAAHALALGCVLVTDNVREFSRVPGLIVENWIRSA